jgi:HD-like signal output (HDOD) protein
MGARYQGLANRADIQKVGSIRGDTFMSNVQAVAFTFVERLARDLKDERLELPAFPDAVLRIQQALQSPDTDSSDIARILGSEPALAARLLRIANSAEFRRVDGEITDLRRAISRMGFNVVRSVAVAFAMRQLRKKETYGPGAQAALEKSWKQSLDTASMCFVLAKQFTKVSPDQAMLTGLLHVLGRLYIVMRAQDMKEVTDKEVMDVANHWHATIAKAILESWGLPEAMQTAIENQDDIETEFEGPVTLTDILISAKLLAPGIELDPRQAACSALRRLGGGSGAKVLDASNSCAAEIKSIRASLSE